MYSLTTTKMCSKSFIETLLQRAQLFADGKEPWKCNGTVVNVFFEPSTRTNLSFQMAAHRLGLHVLNFDCTNSSLKKGESMLDTLQTIEALGANIAVIRSSEDWPAMELDKKVNISLVNAGSGVKDHPTQALLDALTIKQHFGYFQGLTVTIVGDILHSRVARSNIDVLTKLGAKIQLAGPEHYKADDLATFVPWVDFDEAIEESDVVMMLRVQHERHSEKFPYEIGEYHQKFGLTQERVRRMKPNAIMMHPGPVNRGVEIADEVLEDGRCKILQQVRNGVAVRMAVLEVCLLGERYGKLVSA